jgi:hypothetical protein
VIELTDGYKRDSECGSVKGIHNNAVDVDLSFLIEFYGVSITHFH